MNKRQTKKNFKKKHGCNPPKTLRDKIAFEFRLAAVAFTTLAESIERKFADAKRRMLEDKCRGCFGATNGECKECMKTAEDKT